MILTMRAVQHIEALLTTAEINTIDHAVRHNAGIPTARTKFANKVKFKNNKPLLVFGVTRLIYLAPVMTQSEAIPESMPSGQLTPEI